VKRSKIRIKSMSKKSRDAEVILEPFQPQDCFTASGVFGDVGYRIFPIVSGASSHRVTTSLSPAAVGSPRHVARPQGQNHDNCRVIGTLASF